MAIIELITIIDCSQQLATLNLYTVQSDKHIYKILYNLNFKCFIEIFPCKITFWVIKKFPIKRHLK